MSLLEGVPLPPSHPQEFSRRDIELAKLLEKPLSQIPSDLGIAESYLRNWLAQADIDEGCRDGLTADERAGLAQLRREKGRPEMENEILKRAAAYIARENVLPK